MTVRTLVMTVFLIGLYFGSTWFFFGSSHPCEILIVRQKDHHVESAERLHREDVESWREFARKALTKKEYEHFASNIEEYSNASGRKEDVHRSVIIELRQKTREMTSAQCALQAITWDSPS